MIAAFEHVTVDAPTVLGAVVALWLFISAAGALPLLFLRFAGFGYMEDPQGTILQTIDAVGKDWLDEEGFAPEGAIHPLGIRMALFRHRDNHTVFAIYLIGEKVVTDMVTIFPNEVKLTTASTIDGVVAPLTPQAASCSACLLWNSKIAGRSTSRACNYSGNI